jgi:hydrocephalus-inducing protein
VQQVQSAVDVDQPLFQPFPPEVVFHSYEPLQEYSAVLRLRNNDTVRGRCTRQSCLSEYVYTGTCIPAHACAQPVPRNMLRRLCLQVARRVAVEHLRSSLFKVQRLHQHAGKLAPDSSKVAAGMEATFRITFKPDSTASYEQQLVVATERERFLVPLLAVGAAAALDLPDAITLPPAPAKQTSKHTLLVRNVGKAASAFQLATNSSCFAVAPAHMQLAPGEAAQLTLAFTPVAAGLHEAELEVQYGSSTHATFTLLQSSGHELDVGLTLDCGQQLGTSFRSIHQQPQQGLQLPRTVMSKLSQRSFKIFNRSGISVSWTLLARPTQADEECVAAGALTALQQLGSGGSGSPGGGGGSCTISGLPPLPHSAAGARESSRGGMSRGAGGVSSHRISVSSSAASSRCSSGKHARDGSASERASLRPSDDTSGADDAASSVSGGTSLLEDEALALMRLAKRARRDICADQQLFSSPFFTVFPPQGCVHPHSEQEVIVQFAPDCAGSFEALGWLDVQGRAERLPLLMHGEGVGPVVVCSFGDVLDVGAAFVNTPHSYELELINRSRVEARWALEPSHSRFGSKFAFSPGAGLLAPGQSATVCVRLLADCLGRMDELFQVHVAGCAKPVTITIRGEVVGPQFALDVKQLDFGITSFGFRCACAHMHACMGLLCMACAAVVAHAPSHAAPPPPRVSPHSCPQQVRAGHDADQHGRHPPGLQLARGRGGRARRARRQRAACVWHAAAARFAAGAGGAAARTSAAIRPQPGDGHPGGVGRGGQAANQG